MKFVVEHFQILAALGIVAASVLSGFLARGLLLRRLKALAPRYAVDGIVIPFSIRALDVEQESARRSVPARLPRAVGS